MYTKQYGWLSSCIASPYCSIVPAIFSNRGSLSRIFHDAALIPVGASCVRPPRCISCPLGKGATCGRSQIAPTMCHGKHSVGTSRRTTPSVFAALSHLSATSIIVFSLTLEYSFRLIRFCACFRHCRQRNAHLEREAKYVPPQQDSPRPVANPIPDRRNLPCIRPACISDVSARPTADICIR